MDGIDGQLSPVLWVATVNRADLLDSALLRAGRFSKKISVPRPGPEAAIQILAVHLRGVPIAKDSVGEDLAEQIVQRLFSSADDNLLMRIHFSDAEHEEVFPPRVLSGAILAEAVRGATLRAIRRDRSNDSSQPSGIQLADLEGALDEQLHQTVAAITPRNAGLHYLGLPEDRRVVAVECFGRSATTGEQTFLQ
jgi:SpoVK/Ycf46/Vps4 family AAA+-type ATPase